MPERAQAPWYAVFVVMLVPLVLAGLLLAYALVARFVLHGPVDSGSLSRSVEVAAGSSTYGTESPCRRRSTAPRWRCSVWDASASGGVTYVVRVRPGGSCWDARLVGPNGEGPMPLRLSGCVHRWQWTLL